MESTKHGPLQLLDYATVQAAQRSINFQVQATIDGLESPTSNIAQRRIRLGLQVEITLFQEVRDFLRPPSHRA
jgi:hypothetical protein